MLGFFKAWLELHADRRAVTALEYALIAGLIAVVLVGTLTTLGTSLQDTFSRIGSDV